MPNCWNSKEGQIITIIVRQQLVRFVQIICTRLCLERGDFIIFNWDYLFYFSKLFILFNAMIDTKQKLNKKHLILDFEY